MPSAWSFNPDPAKRAGTFDPAAFLVRYNGDRFLADARLLVNDVACHYAVYGPLFAGVWSDPVAVFKDISPDKQEIARAP